MLLVSVFIFFSASYFLFKFWFGYPNPFVVVLSDSMKHTGENWRKDLEMRGIDSSNLPIEGGFERGDILVIKKCELEEISIGDVIVFEAYGRRIAHRVVEIERTGENLIFKTKGDANPESYYFEQSILPEHIQGKVIAVIPKIGNIFLLFSK